MLIDCGIDICHIPALNNEKNHGLDKFPSLRSVLGRVKMSEIDLTWPCFYFVP